MTLTDPADTEIIEPGNPSGAQIVATDATTTVSTDGVLTLTIPNFDKDKMIATTLGTAGLTIEYTNTGVKVSGISSGDSFKVSIGLKNSGDLTK